MTQYGLRLKFHYMQVILSALIIILLFFSSWRLNIGVNQLFSYIAFKIFVVSDNHLWTPVYFLLVPVLVICSSLEILIHVTNYFWMPGILQSYLSEFFCLSLYLYFHLIDERVEAAVQSLRVEFGEQYVWVPPPELLC